MRVFTRRIAVSLSATYGLGIMGILWQRPNSRPDGVEMGKMLQQADRFPPITLKLVDGGTIKLPGEAPSRYTALLFYRGHW